MLTKTMEFLLNWVLEASFLTMIIGLIRWGIDLSL